MNSVSSMICPTTSKVERTQKMLEAFMDLESVDKRGSRSRNRAIDRFEGTPEIEHFNNYTRTGRHAANHSGRTGKSSNLSDLSECEKQKITSDIIAPSPKQYSQFHKNNRIVENIFRKLADESSSFECISDRNHHAWQRYHDPRAPHFIPISCNFNKRQLLEAEWDMIRSGKVHNASAIAWYYYGGKTGEHDPFRLPGNTNGIKMLPCSTDDALNAFLARQNMDKQLNELFEKNNIVIPENVRLNFTIDTSYRFSVTGTNDKDLIKQIETLFNSNGNAQQLFKHILNSANPQYKHLFDSFNPNVSNQNTSTQISHENMLMYRIDTAIIQFTDYTRHDLTLIDGKFMTNDGVDIIEHIRKGIEKENEGFNSLYIDILAGHQKRKLDWLAGVGPENVPEMILSIEFENGKLFDVGQEDGFGPGQTDWIRKLIGSSNLPDLDSWYKTEPDSKTNLHGNSDLPVKPPGSMGSFKLEGIQHERMRNAIIRAINNLFRTNGVSWSEGLNLTITINEDQSFRVTGTDDDELTKRLETLLNSLEFAEQLNMHIKNKKHKNDNRDTDKNRDDNRVDWSKKRNNDYTRYDLNLVDGMIPEKDDDALLPWWFLKMIKDYGIESDWILQILEEAGLDKSQLPDWQQMKQNERLMFRQMLKEQAESARMFAEGLSEEMKMRRKMMETFKELVQGKNPSPEGQQLLAQFAPMLLFIALLMKKEDEESQEDYVTIENDDSDYYSNDNNSTSSGNYYSSVSAVETGISSSTD